MHACMCNHGYTRGFVYASSKIILIEIFPSFNNEKDLNNKN